MFIPFDNINAFFNSTNVSLGHTTQDDTAYAFNDPRIDKLGIHIVSDKNSFGKNELDIVEGDCLDFFLENGILGMHLIEDLTKFYPLENNLHFLNAVDFKKGCYVGQENTARIKLKNKLTKRLLPINIIDGKLHEGEGIFNKENEIGKVLINNEYPFALIKFLDKNFDENAEFKTKEASIKIKKPEWIGK